MPALAVPRFACWIVSLGLVAASTARAEDDLKFQIELKDGVMAPSHLEVPADSTFTLQLHNAGTSPAEFESTELHKEKVLAADAESFVVVRRLAAGKYEFFDDFHPDSQRLVITAK